MSMINNWRFFIIIYLIFSVLFNQSYKITTKNMKSAGALTIIIQIIASLFCLFLIPLFQIKFPNSIKSYLFFGIAIIFYTLNDRLGTTARSKIDASSYSVIKQLSTVFMILFGILLFKEKIILSKIIGSILILFSNVLVFYKKDKLKIDRYIIMGVLANISLTVALLIDINYSNEFNLGIYVFLILLIPSILIFLVEKIKVKEIFIEYQQSNKLSIFLTSISWTIMMISKLKAYMLGRVTIVTPIASLTVILTVIFGYFILKEKDNLLKKMIAAILIVIGIILIEL